MAPALVRSAAPGERSELQRATGSSTTDRRIRSTDMVRLASLAQRSALKDQRNMAALTRIAVLTRARSARRQQTDLHDQLDLLEPPGRRCGCRPTLTRASHYVANFFFTNCGSGRRWRRRWCGRRRRASAASCSELRGLRQPIAESAALTLTPPIERRVDYAISAMYPRSSA